MVSLKVATERADLAKVERQIVSTQRDIRSLQTELGTRGRLAQLEDWNANVLALSAPAANQFVPDHLTLARLEQKAPTVDQRSAEVHVAALDTGPASAKAAPRAEAPLKAPKLIRAVQPASTAPEQPPLVRHASFTTASEAPAAPARNAAKLAAAPSRPSKSRLESIASEIGTAARAEHSEKTGRERSAGTR
jgi:hypothetical protein